MEGHIQCLTKRWASSSKVSHYFRFLQLATAQQFVRLTRRQLTPFFYGVPLRFCTGPFRSGRCFRIHMDMDMNAIWDTGSSCCRNASAAECNRTMATCQLPVGSTQKTRKKNAEKNRKTEYGSRVQSISRTADKSGSLSRKH